jgi:hydrogenase large subunit
MSKRITIDPITRIEGHLRIDVEVDQGKVQKAWASSTMFRGIERILLGRDPREAWLFTQRFCGVCTTVHALASVRAVEDALDLEIPLNAQYIRNLILIARAARPRRPLLPALRARLGRHDPGPQSRSEQSRVYSREPLRLDRQLRQTDGLRQTARRGARRKRPARPVCPWVLGHPAMKLPPEINLIAVSHYLQALEYQRYSNQVVAMLGGKTPHIQNVAVGGVANAINLESEAALNIDRLFQMKSLLEKIISFVQNVYVPDVCAIAGFYPDWFSYGAGVTNYLSVPDLPLDGKSTQFELPGGFIPNGDLSKLVPITGQKDETWRRAVTEDSAHAWYKGGGPVHPWKGETDPEPTEWDEEKKYPWVKAPRYNG